MTTGQEASDELWPLQLNLHDSKIRVFGKEGPIERWEVRFLTPSGLFKTIEDIPDDDERWVAVPVPVAMCLSQDIELVCVGGDYGGIEAASVADLCPSGRSSGSEEGAEGNQVGGGDGSSDAVSTSGATES